MYQFKFADIGEGLHEGKVTEIHVKVGDQVKDGDSLFSVETDKVTSEITSPVDGKVAVIKIVVDQTVHVGETVFVIDDGSKENSVSKENDLPEKALVAPVQMTPVQVAKPLTSNVSADVKISSVAKRMALDLQVDLTEIKGTGIQGRIMSYDLTNNSKKQTEKVVNPAPLTSLDTALKSQRIKTTSLRQAIAKNLKRSWENVAYVTQVVEVDVTDLSCLRSQYKDLVFEKTGIKLTFLPFICKAVSLALLKFPIFCASYDEKTQEMVYPRTLNLGIAVDTDAGLLVPNIKDAQTKTVLELSKNISDLAKKARLNSLKAAEMNDGHFTITNYGSAGAIFGVPVIKFPEIAILGVGAIVPRALGDGQTHDFMYLTLAADHRWVDGVLMAKFVSEVKFYLQNPALLGIF